ncbi:MAG: rhodanese-like domain-containing protein [Candidatus Sumerlaeia bacterium]|nr:rhodanese-like domain-containing protein [Candidatus Sumerlaeia bacterium]
MGFFSFLFGNKEQEAPEAPKTPPPSSGSNDWESVGAVPQELAAKEVLALLEAPDPPVFLDVREAEELAADGFIPGSTHIPVDDLEGRLGELDPTRPVVVYCASGMRSMDAGAFLLEKGFSEVSNLNGGLSTWAGPLEKKAE